MTKSNVDIPSHIVMVQTKKRILLVVRWPNGGIRTFIRYVYRHFEPEMFHLTVLGPDLPEMNVLQDDLNCLDVETKRVSARPTVYEFFMAISKELIYGRYDLIHSQGFTSGICASFPAFLTRKPHILTSHDVLNGTQFRGISGYLKKIGMGMAFSLIPTIHSVSYDAQQNLLEFFPFLDRAAERCKVIRNGIEVERFLDVEPRDLRSELCVGDEFFLIGFLGRFMAQKGFGYLIDAIESLSRNNDLTKKPLVIAFGEDGFVREERARIAERGLIQYFRFLPFTPNVAGVIKAMDMVAMPSLWEACPLLPMEALVAGTPLIATNCIGLREVVLNTPALVISPKDGNALAVGIESFMKDDRTEIFKQYSLEARKEFDVKTQAKQIRDIIINLTVKSSR
jgi:glycosyltransferase involved in cell wall biosynthesis